MAHHPIPSKLAVLTVVTLFIVVVSCTPKEKRDVLTYKEAIAMTKNFYFREGIRSFSKADVVNNNSKPCSCKGYTCSCCVHLDVKKIDLNQTACVSITYLRSEIGLELKVTLDGKTVIDKKVSVKNPPAICVAIPKLKKLASICLELSNLSVKDKHFSGCAAIDIKLAFQKIAHFKLGCFRIPPTMEDGEIDMEWLTQELMEKYLDFTP